jgi:hypothetical protein
LTNAEILTLSLAAVTGPLSGVVWYFAQRSLEKRTRGIVKEELSGIIDLKLSAFKEQLNGPTGFRRSQSCDLMMKPHDEAIARISSELHALRVARSQGAS